MVEADSNLKLLPPSMLDIYKVFEHIDMLSIGIWKQPYTVINPSWLRLWGSGSLMLSGNDVITLWLMLTATSTCFLVHVRHIQVFEHIDMLFIGIR
jgi:hypothetical protein